MQLPEPEEVLDDDLMVSNPVMPSGASETQQKNRFVREIRVLVNVDSRDRDRYAEVLLPPGPDGYIRTKISDYDGESVSEEFTAQMLNRESGCETYVQKGNMIYERIELDSSPADFQVSFSRALNNVKSVRLIDVNVPYNWTAVNSGNRLIAFDLRLPEKQNQNQDLPFYVARLPVGNWSAPELIRHFERALNASLSKAGASTRFRVETLADRRLRLRLRLPSGDAKFHLRFQKDANTSVGLWELLGFARSTMSDESGDDLYSSELEGNFPVDTDVRRHLFLEVSGFASMFNAGGNEAPYRHDFFAKVDWRSNAVVSNPMVFSSPLDHLDRLHLRWIDPLTGKSPNFMNKENSSVFEVAMYRDELDNLGVSSRRGVADGTSFSQSMFFPNQSRSQP
ncbi:MAG: hypothetical protein ACYCOU_03530 [Sulfobacillus sp.]